MARFQSVTRRHFFHDEQPRLPHIIAERPHACRGIEQGSLMGDLYGQGLKISIMLVIG
jgi:hypothetical protein